MSESIGSELGLPQEKRVSGQQWDSGHKGVALTALEKTLSHRIRGDQQEATDASIQDQVLQKKEKLKVWLDAIDREAVNNFGIFESEENPGVRFPYTKIRVRNVASEVQNTPIGPETEELPAKTVVVFTPFIPLSGGGPDNIINYSHWMDPGRWPDKWVRGIERYEELVNAQMHV